MKKKTLAWAGFCDGNLHFTMCDDQWGGKNIRLMPSIFKSKKAAQEQYQDVRRVEIREVRRKRK